MVHTLLFEFNGEALQPGALARRMLQVAGLETLFLAEQGGVPAGLLVLRVVPTISDAEDWAEITGALCPAPVPAAGHRHGACLRRRGAQPGARLRRAEPVGRSGQRRGPSLLPGIWLPPGFVRNAAPGLKTPVARVA